MLQHIIAQAQAKQVPTGESIGEVQLMEDTVSPLETTITENNIAIDALNVTAQSYMILADTCFAAAKKGGLDESGVNAIIAGTQGSGAIIGDKVDLPSGESFDEAGGRVDATMLAGESIKDRALNLYKTVKDFIMRQVKRLKDLWKDHFSSLGRMKKSIEKAQTDYASVEGTVSKAKFKINLKNIMADKKPATADVVSAEAKTHRETAKDLTIKAKAATSLIKVLEAGKYADVISGLSSTDNVPQLANSGKASDTQVKQAGLQEGYKQVAVSSELLGGSFVFMGTPEEGSSKGPRSKWVGGTVEDKVGNIEFPTLSSTEIGKYLEAAAAMRNTADALTVAASEYTEAMDNLAKAMDKAEKADETEQKEAAKAVKKIQDLASIPSDGVRGLISHCVSAAKTSYNYAVSSAKLYKKTS